MASNKYCISAQQNLYPHYGLFVEACRLGELNRAKEMYRLHKISIQVENDRCFRVGYENGHLNVVLWIHSLGIININSCCENILSCCIKRGHLDVVRWIYSLYAVDVASYTRHLMYIKENDIHMLHFLLEYGAKFHYSTPCPSHFINWSNKLETYAILLLYCAATSPYYRLLDKTIVEQLSNKIIMRPEIFRPMQRRPT